MSRFTKLACAIVMSVSTAIAMAVPVIVFQTNFDGALPPEIAPGTATLTGVQGFAGYGPISNQFSGNFLRSSTLNTVTLNLTNLPTHDTISLAFLFAAIDSLDGTGVYPAGDFFKIVFDGVILFDESFANATATQIQSYVPPTNVELARHVPLGFTGGLTGTVDNSYYTDSAYDFGADPRFADFAHTGSTATIEFYIHGPGNQGLDDESWAMDKLTVSVSTIGRAPAVPIPEPGSLALLGLGLAGLAFSRKVKKQGD